MKDMMMMMMMMTLDTAESTFKVRPLFLTSIIGKSFPFFLSLRARKQLYQDATNIRSFMTIL